MAIFLQSFVMAWKTVKSFVYKKTIIYNYKNIDKASDYTLHTQLLIERTLFWRTYIRNHKLPFVPALLSSTKPCVRQAAGRGVPCTDYYLLHRLHCAPSPPCLPSEAHVNQLMKQWTRIIGKYWVTAVCSCYVDLEYISVRCKLAILKYAL